MLTSAQIAANKENYLRLVSEVICQEDDFYKYLEATDYFNKPASTKHLRAYPGGLCEHALTVYHDLVQLAHLFYNDAIDEASLIRVALLKDIYKAQLFEAYFKNAKNDETGQWEKVVDYRYAEAREVFGDLPFSSYMVAKRFTIFSDEEIEAICQYQLIAENGLKNPDVYNIMRKYPLVLLLHMADLSAGYLV
jgi:hypothetical protein